MMPLLWGGGAVGVKFGELAGKFDAASDLFAAVALPAQGLKGDATRGADHTLVGQV